MKHTSQYKMLLFSVIQLVAFAMILATMLSACGGELPEVSGTKETTTETTAETTTEATTGATTVPEETRELKGNPYLADDFYKENGFLHCSATKTAVCIDISNYQGDVNWKKVKAAGVDYVILRAGFRGYGSAGNIVADASVEKNYLGAREAGLKVGFYFFSQAKTVKEGQEEARFVLDMVKDWQVDLPIACDWEYKENYRVSGMSKAAATNCVKAFCETVEDAGYQSMFYCTDVTAFQKLDLQELRQFGIWYADYQSFLGFDYQVDMWQYSEKGKVSGISGNVDLNLIFFEDSIFEGKLQ